MRIAVASRVAVAATILSAVAGLGAASPAAASGGALAVPPGRQASIAAETALLSWDGKRETLVLDLNLLADTDNAVLVVPTPSRASLEPVAETTFVDLNRLTLPEIVTERRWFGAGAPTGASDGPDQATLEDPTGPFETFHFTGAQLADMRTWLAATGYALRPEAHTALDEYGRDGWSFVAIRLTRSGSMTGTPSLTGRIDPIRLSFATERPVYPMRISGTAPQRVQLYVLSDHRVARSDTGATTQTVDVEFAGRIADTTNPTLTGMADGGRNYLTKMSVAIPDPSSRTTDFTFAAAPTDDEVRGRLTVLEPVEFLGMPAGPVILAPATAAAALVLFALVRTLRRQPK
ncbi:hypothetical protein NBRGN_043_00120 [Nocardia brasiliensis NBRC 14402]|uniref:DUF2330 domain-containing protein n=1 Tax=Nocardia brasiliensis TaxID=37326 RepID=UPI0003099218|nr:DUF2330 domain-containing protein [Nocardia brasiliensis]ASF10324.1 DUF2330 domain-containing protein [Nocardia brasiliensis]GAJ81702.1 hypothetical protein NBRGN_043_00120 [Nocardia brasiliensis NBRC 14402]SUB11206.1 Uncharacterized protein conserved in bacteria (DUF2330) [Nocardia brasiliensis]